jgi:hypothetical protein
VRRSVRDIPTEEMETIQIRVRASFKRRIEHLAVDQRTTKEETVRRLLEQALGDAGPGESRRFRTPATTS